MVMATAFGAKLTLILSCMLWLSTAQQRVDLTLQPEASGEDVVRAVVNKIQEVFGSDQQFLRRIAFVESKDGTDSGTYRAGYHGGIWQVDEVGFEDTQNIASHPALTRRFEQILDTFEIDWTRVQWSDLRIPLYSGIAARLHLLNNPNEIPCDIQGQATYWKQYYNTPDGDGTEMKFIEDVNALESNNKCHVNSDIMLVLDESGSIGSDNFESVKQFALEFVNDLRIGSENNQIGVITFSDSARLQFGLSAYDDSTSLGRAVQNLDYDGGYTNIPDALCQLFQVFSGNETGTRMGSTIFRIGIVMTDGQSNENSNACGFSTVVEAAQAVHALTPPVFVFAFGVGDGYRREDVEDIASGDNFISDATSFSFESQLQCVQNVQEENICHTISTPVPIMETTTGELGQREEVRWMFEVPETGLAFSLDAQDGRIVFYASVETTAPNEAFHEWKIEASFSIQTINIIPAASSRVMRNSDANVTSIPVFATLVGLEERNVFSLSTSDELIVEGVNLGAAIGVPITLVILLIVIAIAVAAIVKIKYERSRI